MTKPLDVFFTERAPVARSMWLQRLLQPVCEAARMQPIPLEVRPTGYASGFCANHKLARDKRVSISSGVVFWTAQGVVDVYLHESTHRLFSARDVLSHGPEFVALNAILMNRCKSFFDFDSILFLSLYDFSDCPPELENEPDWRGIVLNWSLKTAAELADTNATAESLADVVCDRWQAFLVQRELDSAATANAAAGAVLRGRQHAQNVLDLKSSRMFWRCLSGLGWSMFFVLVWFIVRGFK